MSKYDNAFPSVQKVQIFEQVNTYIENNHTTDPEIQATIEDLKTLITNLQTQHPTVTTETQAIGIIDAEFTEIKRNPAHKLAILRKQLLNPERHLQAIKATAAEVTLNITSKKAFGQKPASPTSTNSAKPPTKEPNHATHDRPPYRNHP
jgi:hypothetical protein